MMKLMNKKLTKKGFTLAELLIVVAIIAILVAVSIPVFTSQLAKSRLATNQANARAAYAMAVATELESDVTAAASYTYTVKTGSIAKDGTLATASVTTSISDWNKDTSIDGYTMGAKVATKWTVVMDASGNLSGFKADYTA